jgi:hypothetical protein
LAGAAFLAAAVLVVAFFAGAAAFTAAFAFALIGTLVALQSALDKSDSMMCWWKSRAET